MAAGFDVIAVDNQARHLKRSPARWKVHGDAFDVLAAIGSEVDLIWAGWPCQAYTAGLRANRARGITNGHKRLIAAGREAMQATGTPWVIENVYGARTELRTPLLLCGRMFDLKATDDDGTPLVMDSHRVFESTMFLTAPWHDTHDDAQVGGSYGGGRRNKHDARHVRHGGYVPSAALQAELMGITHPMTEEGLHLAIPPVYAAYLGAQILELLAA